MPETVDLGKTKIRVNLLWVSERNRAEIFLFHSFFHFRYSCIWQYLAHFQK